MSNNSSSKIFGGCLTVLFLAVVYGAIDAFFGWVFMMLWNWLAPLFWTTAPVLTFWQAWGVCILLSWIGSFFKNKSK